MLVTKLQYLMNITSYMIPQELWKNLGTPFAVANYHY